MKVLFVAESGMHDYMRTALKRHTKVLGGAVSLKTNELGTARVDHFNVIIYFDDSKAFFCSHVTLNIDTVVHAHTMSKKGIKALIVSRNTNPDYKWIYRVWHADYRLDEIGQVDTLWYSFDSCETRHTGINSTQDRYFDSMDWADFEKRFVFGKKES